MAARTIETLRRESEDYIKSLGIDGCVAIREIDQRPVLSLEYGRFGVDFYITEREISGPFDRFSLAVIGPAVLALKQRLNASNG
ncbi:MAG: hypothetical protein KIT15_17045 [Xanthobacteraceae bacterium]|nr:hypothetical protein [Xanthobacteraceae bacterium]